jgi:hypothetical protein
MDGKTFDRLSRRFGGAGSRRGLLGLLAALPLAGALMRLDEEIVAAKRHKKHHKHKKHKKHKCHPEPTDQLCAGKCDLVTNKCGKQVDCGPCTCATGCPQCQTCDTGTGLCVPNGSVVGQVCGTGQVCRADGRCSCDASSCLTGCCGADGTCGACLAFVTSTVHNGNLGGLSGADAICQARAAAGGLPGASESGTYKAWLTDMTGSPSTRFRCTQASCSSQGYKRVDDAPIASDWSTLTDGTLEFAISVTELNTFVRRSDSTVWTNTTITGTEGQFPSSCLNSNWSSPGSVGDTGIATAFDALWTDTGGGIPCGAEVHLYCFQQS